MAQLRPQGGGEVTQVTLCKEAAPLRHCSSGQVKGYVMLLSRRNEITEELPCVSMYGNISYQRIKSSERTDLNFTEEHCQGASSLH